MNPLQVVMSELHLQIPEEILSLACRDLTAPEGQPSASIDSAVSTHVIVPIALPRINSVTGKQKDIRLEAAFIEPTSREYHIAGLGGSQVYRIPPHARENREIVEVRGLRSSRYDDEASVPNNAFNLQKAMLASHTYGDRDLISATPILREANIIQVRPSLTAEGALVECLLGFDRHFTGLPNHAHVALAQYVTSLTKSWIRSRRIFIVEQGELRAGAATSRFREYLDRWEEENPEKQARLLDTLRGAILFDKEQLQGYMALAL